MNPTLNTNEAFSLRLVSELASRYDLASLTPLMEICKSIEAREDLGIALLGRFKAGKSSFLNHLIGRNLLPVGVVPVTSVITEVQWGPHEQAEIRFADGHAQTVSLEKIAEFVTEAKNPENKKQVKTANLYLPDLERYQGLRLLDTPGLESAFAHNTERSLTWVPNVDVALVAIGVDPPLAYQDVKLIRKLFRYTPKVCVLLTKVDLLTESEASEVIQFVRKQLNQNFDQPIQVFPYSTRAGFASLQTSLEEELLTPTLSNVRQQKREILDRKLKTLLQECGDFLRLALRSAEMADQKGQELRRLAATQREALADAILELQLVARHTIGGSRHHIEQKLFPHENAIARELSESLEREYTKWKLSFAQMLNRFETWLLEALRLRLTDLSTSCQPNFLKPLADVQRQSQRILQAFRDRLSDRTLELFGVPLRTAETEIEPRPPSTPDVKIGRMFDHNWELLSPLIPMGLVRGAVKSRFLHKVEYETFKSLSRLTTQWADIVNAAIANIEREAERRLQELVQTVEHLTTHLAVAAPSVRSDLDRVRQAQVEFDS